MSVPQNVTDELEAALTAARIRKNNVERQIRKAIVEATAAINARHVAEKSEATAAVNLAQSALDTHLEQVKQADPIVGRRVLKPAQPYSFMSPARPQKDGVIEVFKRGDEYVGNYPPKPGMLVIRAVKKNGATGAKVEPFYGEQLPYGWQYADEPRP